MKDNNLKIKPVVIIGISILAAVLIIAAIVVNAISKDKNKETSKGMTLTEKNLRPQDSTAEDYSNKEKTSVEILMDDTAIPVGVTFMASAIVEPEDTDKALVWTSSNNDVMTVEQSGLVTITGIGTAALTATVGDVSDAVAIEGIESVTAGSSNGYVVYTGNGSPVKSSDSSGSSSGTITANASGDEGVSSSNDGSSVNNIGSNNSGNTTVNTSGSNGNSSNNSGSSNNSSNNNTSNNNSANNSGNASNNSNSNNSSGNTSSDSGSNNSSDSSNKGDGIESTDLPDILDNSGFKQEYSNVYVYTENDTYYGEIIVQPNVSIIYIKQRSGGFDSKIQSVLSQLLPESYNQVWNNYVSATTDRTFTVEGRRVRIVTASKGGHSQIVIYN